MKHSTFLSSKKNDVEHPPPIKENIEQNNKITKMLPVKEIDEEIFGTEICKQLEFVPLPPKKASLKFIPGIRSVDELFQEDEKSSANYATTIAEDDILDIDCLGLKVTNIDSWKEAQLPDSLIKNIKKSCYIKPRQIQAAVVPLILDGYDVIAHAPTGSGKTAAYLIPVISECIEAKIRGTFQSKAAHPFCVLLAPTRELVKQCYEQAVKFAHDTGVSVGYSYNKLNHSEIIKNIKQKECDIFCLTPGRFKYLFLKKYLKFEHLRFLIFDEADMLLTHEYLNDIKPVLENPSFPNGKLRQTLFFSATFNHTVIERAKQFMRPERALVSNHTNVVNKNCIQEFVAHELTGKFAALIDFLKNELKKVEYDANKFPRTLIFSNTCEYSEKLASALCYSGINSMALSSLRAQDLRENAIYKFRSNNLMCLIVTDVCARGLDFKDIDLVINYDIPLKYETYIHRAGRVGRIRKGKCLSYVSFEYKTNVVNQMKKVLFQIKKGFQKSNHIIPPSLEKILDQLNGIKTVYQFSDTSEPPSEDEIDLKW